MTDNTMASNFVYVTFIRTTPEKLWSALITEEFMKQYWFGMHLQAEWKVGAPWKLLFNDGRTADAGEILEFDPPKKLVLKWRNEWNPELNAEGFARCTFDLEPSADAVKLTITHSMERPGSALIQKVSGGWPVIVSNLKSLLETGQVVLKTM